MNAAVAAVPIGRLEGLTSSRTDDWLAVEEPMEIRLGARSLSITMRTPGNDFELAAGFLHSEGLIRDIFGIRSISRPPDGDTNIVVVELDGENGALPQSTRNFTMTSACGVCGKASLRDLEVNACPILPPDDIKVFPEIVYRLPDALRRAQSVFDTTGGLHAAALFNLQGELESLREDIGRHNAVDKLIGSALMERRTPLSASLLLVSGRASFELVQKALVAGIPVMAAVGAPSSLAVATAERSGMTLMGFLRSGRFNVYAASHRVLGML
jgi:FdhD protein